MTRTVPTAVLLERRKAEREARKKERAAALPTNHKIILVPADPTYSPMEEALWPIINETIYTALRPHPEVFAKVVAAVDRALDEHRGWRNPFPADLDCPNPAKLKKIKFGKTNPAILLKTNDSSPRVSRVRRFTNYPNFAFNRSLTTPGLA